jgi:membrane-associated protein
VAFLQGLHGGIALVLLCGLLFIEETGIPLLFAPGDLVLISAGLLIATGALDPRLFIPAAVVACVFGALLGYTWTRQLGEPAVRSLAAKLGFSKQLDRVLLRVRGTHACGVAVARLIPGLRIYTTLAAGIAGVTARTFLLGVISSTLVWVPAFTALGALVGLPAELVLGRFEKLAFDGLILLVAGLGGYLIIRAAPLAPRSMLREIPPTIRILLEAIFGAAILSAISAGALTIGRNILRTTDDPWIDVLLIGGVVLGWWLAVAARRPPGGVLLRDRGRSR